MAAAADPRRSRPDPCRLAWHSSEWSEAADGLPQRKKIDEIVPPFRGFQGELQFIGLDALPVEEGRDHIQHSIRHRLVGVPSRAYHRSLVVSSRAQPHALLSAQRGAPARAPNAAAGVCDAAANGSPPASTRWSRQSLRRKGLRLRSAERCPDRARAAPPALRAGPRRAPVSPAGPYRQAPPGVPAIVAHMIQREVSSDSEAPTRAGRHRRLFGTGPRVTRRKTSWVRSRAASPWPRNRLRYRKTRSR